MLAPRSNILVRNSKSQVPETKIKLNENFDRQADLLGGTFKTTAFIAANVIYVFKENQF